MENKNWRRFVEKNNGHSLSHFYTLFCLLSFATDGRASERNPAGKQASSLVGERDGKNIWQRWRLSDWNEGYYEMKNKNTLPHE